MTTTLENGSCPRPCEGIYFSLELAAALLHLAEKAHSCYQHTDITLGFFLLKNIVIILTQGHEGGGTLQTGKRFFGLRKINK